MKKVIFCLLSLLPVLLFGQGVFVTTTPPYEITPTTAKSGGKVQVNLCTLVERGVCWSTVPNPTYSDLRTSDGNIQGTFTSNITGLAPGTIYYVRAYAWYQYWFEDYFVYGNEYSFITFTIPTLTTTPVTFIDSTSASSGGKITDDGGDPVTARGVCWGTAPYPIISLTN